MPEKAHGKYLLTGGMLLCPTCNGHFEAQNAPWKRDVDGVYVCATRRRKPGVCTNKMALPITQTDNDILSVIEGEVLSPRFINELLLFLETAGDEVGALSADLDRLRAEVQRLVDSIAVGVPAATVAPQIRQRENDITRIERRLQAARPVPPNREQLRDALLQRVETWRSELRREPKIARMVLRRLIGPVTLHDESTRPSFVPQLRWDAPTKADGLIDGLSIWLASPTGTAHILRPEYRLFLPAA